jgi:hypothetical protein
MDALSGSPELVKKIGDFFYKATVKLIDDGSFTFVDGKKKGADVVRRVFRVAPIVWLANLVSLVPTFNNQRLMRSQTSTDRHLLEEE